MPGVEEVLTRDLSTGRIHKRYREEGSTELFSLEADNLDEAGAFEEVDRSVLDDPDGDLCQRCFKPVTFASAGVAEGEGKAT